MRAEAIDILRNMPHRNPMLLVDAIQVEDDSDRAVAFKNITFCEPCYRSADAAQYQEELAYPLSLLVESFGQAAGLLLWRRGFLATASTNNAVVFGEFAEIDVVGSAFPGDQLRHEVKLDYAGPQLVILSGQTKVLDRAIANYAGLKAFLVDKAALVRQGQHG